MTNTTARIREWPYGFLDEFWERWRIPEQSTPLEDISNNKEAVGTVEYILATTPLKPRDVDIIRMRFQRRMTYSDIAEFFSLSTTRIMEIVHRAMKRLRDHGRNKSILTLGVIGYARQCSKLSDDEQIQVLVDARVRELRYEDAKYWANRHNSIMGVAANSQDNSIMAPMPINKPSTWTLETKLSDLPLSIRTFNALRRANLITIGDTINFERERGLLRIRNLGKKSYNETISLLEKLNFCVNPRDIAI